jgi:hypothetical protein
LVFRAAVDHDRCAAIPARHETAAASKAAELLEDQSEKKFSPYQILTVRCKPRLNASRHTSTTEGGSHARQRDPVSDID